MIIPWLTFSCSANDNKPVDPQPDDSLSKITRQQEEAFEALNTIQITGQHLYSTFPGISHECLPADSSFVISSDQFCTVLKALLAKYYTGIPKERQEELAEQSALAQEEYLVLQCNGYINEFETPTNQSVPSSGSWILPRVLDSRDIIINW